MVDSFNGEFGGDPRKGAVARRYTVDDENFTSYSELRHP
jgi:hypothetical protein